VIDSRVGAHFEPRAFKVFLAVDEKVGAIRIHDNLLHNPARVTEIVATVEEVIENMRNRYESESEKFKRLYGIENHFDPKHFNFVINKIEIDTRNLCIIN
jgi:cytidylate kinase